MIRLIYLPSDFGADFHSAEFEHNFENFHPCDGSKENDSVVP